ncbi:hypothetical protein EON67_12355, partial [archaeon]
MIAVHFMCTQASTTSRAAAPRHAGMTMVPVGAAVLLRGDVTVLKIAVGLFFITFSGLRLTQAARALGEQRAIARAGYLADDAGEASVRERRSQDDTSQPAHRTPDGATDAPSADVAKIAAAGQHAHTEGIESNHVHLPIVFLSPTKVASPHAGR